jgi:hypothetical protein
MPLQKLVDRLVTRAAIPFFDALREDHVFLVSWILGSYLVLQVVVVNAATDRASLCGGGAGCSFPSILVLCLGCVILLGGTLKRLTDLEARRIQQGPGGSSE